MIFVITMYPFRSTRMSIWSSTIRACAVLTSIPLMSMYFSQESRMTALYSESSKGCEYAE